MKFSHVVVKAGNGKPEQSQIDDAAMVKNAGQVFAIVHTFKDEPKQAILITGDIAKDIEEHAEAHDFEIHELEKPETGEPVKPGDALEESVAKDLVKPVLESLTRHDNKYVSQLAVLTLDELKLDTLV